MKKILAILLSVLVVLTLASCSSNQEEIPTIDEPQIDEPIIVGGYTEAEDKNLTPELIEMFNSAFKGFSGASYTPVMLEATQIVAGTNYKFLADGTKTTNPIIQGSYYVYINKDLENNISLLDIEVIEEHEVKEFVPEIELDTNIKKDVTQMSFWVVFYDQYGNELQREVLKYGTTPEYKSWLPEGFDNWVYKNTDIKVDTFKPIKTNTYFQAKCHYVYHEPEVDNTPEKGELIKLYVGSGVKGADTDGNMIFRVLSKNNKIHKLLGLNSIESYEFNSESMTDFGGINAMIYEDGYVDTKLSNWYTTSDSSVKNAIKSTSLKQHLVEWIEEYEDGATLLSGCYYKFDKFIELQNNKYVFAPGIDDILDYLDGTLSAEGIRNLLKTNEKTMTIWSRCSGYDHIHPCQNNVAVRMSGHSYSEISVDSMGGDPLADIVPCFYIDLNADGVIYEIYSED